LAAIFSIQHQKSGQNTLQKRIDTHLERVLLQNWVVDPFLTVKFRASIDTEVEKSAAKNMTRQ